MPKDVSLLWGLLEREEPPATRRVRDLQLRSAVIFFNELAVPGMGGMYFAKPLFWALLGLWLAEQNGTGRLSAIRLANAVEALACWQVINGEADIPDPSRVRGRRILPNKKAAFRKLGTARGYVTNPLRRTVIQPLQSLGLAEGEDTRFNSLSLTKDGERFLQLLDPNKNLRKALLSWVCKKTSIFASTKARDGGKLSPFVPLKEPIAGALAERIRCDPVRRIMWDWMEKVAKNGAKAQNLPPEREKELWAGILFFNVRQNAIALLDATEELLRNQESLSYTTAAKQCTNKLKRLKESAQKMMDDKAWHCFAKGSEEGCQVTSAFLHDCLETDDPSVLQKLVRRDGRILLDGGDVVRPGTAFLEQEGEEDRKEAGDAQPKWPECISVRVSNLYWLYRDLQGAQDDS